MDRRAFLAAAAVPLVDTPFIFAQGREKISIDAIGFTFHFPSGGKPWRVTADHVKIAGLTIPKFTTSWVGLQLASGLLSAAGGFIFQALLSALGLGGPSMKELLEQQLRAIEKVVREIVEQNEINNCVTDLEAIRLNMSEYMNAPAGKSRLFTASDDSQKVISRLRSFGFKTYSVTVCAGSLRLAILHERSKLDRQEKKNYEGFVSMLEEYHGTYDKLVLRLTTLSEVIRASLAPPLANAKDGPFKIAADGMVLAKVHSHRVTQPLLETPVRSIPRVGEKSREFADQLKVMYEAQAKKQPFYQPKAKVIQFPGIWGMIRNQLLEQIQKPGDEVIGALVDWPKFRQQVQEKSTGAGGKMVSDWKESMKIVTKL
jgi:hypothetical protein